MDDRVFRIVLVDDHDVVRAGLKALFDGANDLEVVGEAGTSAEAIRRAGLDNPNVVVLDVRLPDGSGIDTCREIKTRWPSTHVLILTSYADNDALLEAYDAGASGYVLKRVDAAGLIKAVRKVAHGDHAFGGALDTALASRVRSGDRNDSKLDSLSLQERRVLDLLAEGKTNKQIAQEMFLSDKTVKNYVSHMLTKLDMTSRTEAAAYAASVKAERKTRYPAEDW
ncbi:MAG: response regulator [Acidimicrobiia bacterium]